jgi:predicted TIM-barrel fold metal-dependent hydrolase
MTLTSTDRPAQARTKLAVIDCDIHPYVPSEATLSKYMSARWRAHHETYGQRGYSGLWYPFFNQNAARADAWPPTGGPPGSDLPFLQRQLLDQWELEAGVMLPLMGTARQLNLEYAAARARAVNEWQVAEWCEPEPRLRGSIVLPAEAPDLAVQEIERCAGNAHFVQVELEARTLHPLGKRYYWPIYEAACKHDLPIGIHFGVMSGWPLSSGGGHPSYYVEYHVGQLTSFQDQVASFVFEGVFDRFPTLKIVLVEGGFGWLPPLMWRMDRAYQKLRSEVPDLKRLPSEYVRDHVWFTTQPVEEPETRGEMEQLLRDLDMDDKIMFATDYPHWDFDAPDAAIPAWLPLERRRAIMAENARKLYRF